MKLEKIFEFFPHIIIGLFFSALFIAIAFSKPHKYTVWALGNAYHVDNFRIIGGQLVLEERGKRVIIKGNYIIEINETKCTSF